MNEPRQPVKPILHKHLDIDDTMGVIDSTKEDHHPIIRSHVHAIKLPERNQRLLAGFVAHE